MTASTARPEYVGRHRATPTPRREPAPPLSRDPFVASAQRRVLAATLGRQRREQVTR